VDPGAALAHDDRAGGHHLAGLQHAGKPPLYFISKVSKNIV
jgi:hypothetical protein